MTPAAGSRAAIFEAVPDGGWWFRRWAGRRVAAGMTDRHSDLAGLIRSLEFQVVTMAAEQVHGGSVAVIEQGGDATTAVPGCDALLTGVAGLALLVRTADCLPIFFADPGRGVIGIAHVGWRGLAASLPERVVSAFRRTYHTQASELRVAFGPAIRACCYEVGPEFAARFGSFVQEREGRRTCDLIGVARAQLLQDGIRPDRLVDCRRCTACEPQHWFSLRREGPSAGRMSALIVLRP